MPITDFQGKTAVVTGAGSGIGFAIAQALADRGCNLALLDVRADRIHDAAASLARDNTIVSTHDVDVGDALALAHACAGIRERHAAIHLLINAAGVSVAGPFAHSTHDDFEWIMRINFMGTVNGCRTFLPELLAAPEAHNVNVSSSFGLLGFANKAAYSASKFAVRGFSEALRMELATERVGVSILYPGPVATNIVRDGRAPSDTQRASEDAFLRRRGLPPEYVARKTLDGIRKNRARIMLSTDYRVIDFATRACPSWTQRLAAHLARRFPF